MANTVQICPWLCALVCVGGERDQWVESEVARRKVRCCTVVQLQKEPSEEQRENRETL